LIINAGKNVYPQDIEAIVNTIEGVKSGRCVVFAVYSEREGTELIALVAELEDMTLDHKTMNKQIRQRIARQSTISVSYISLVDKMWLIKTSSGKIARDANRKKWLREQGHNQL
jgi:fatty-acyl-CoA synthase